MKIRKKLSKRIFKNGVKKVHKKNLRVRSRRGGIRG